MQTQNTQTISSGRSIVYRRVSTVGQRTDRQFDGWTFDCEFEDKLSGKNADRPQLQACLKELRSGDTLYVHEMYRLGRNVEDLRRIVMNLVERGVTVKFQSEGLEFTSENKDAMKAAMSKMMLTVIGATGEFELAYKREAIKEGLASARLRGVKLGGHHPVHAKVRARVHNKLVQRDQDHGEYIGNALTAGMTYDQIARQMTMQGVKSPRGSDLTGTSVRRMAKRLEII